MTNMMVDFIKETKKTYKMTSDDFAIVYIDYPTLPDELYSVYVLFEDTNYTSPTFVGSSKTLDEAKEIFDNEIKKYE